MSAREELQAALDAALAEKAKLAEIVTPLREKRDALMAQLAPIEAEAAKIAEQIKAHMPAMSVIDKKVSAAAKALGHPRVGGKPRLIGR